MEPESVNWLAELLNYGVLGVIAAVGIWGVMRALSGMWNRLAERDDQILATHGEYKASLEKMNGDVLKVVGDNTIAISAFKQSMETFPTKLDNMEGRLSSKMDTICKP